MDYNALEPEEFINMVLKDPNLTPCLMVGKYVNAFKRMFKGDIVRTYTLDEARRAIEAYEGVRKVNSKYLVLEGVGYLSRTGQNAMLKFIEESTLPLILLSYSDNVLGTIRSRMKVAVKQWEPVKSLETMDVRSVCKTYIEKKRGDENFKGNNEVQFLADNSPSLYASLESAGNPYDSYMNMKILGILSSLKEAR